MSPNANPFVRDLCAVMRRHSTHVALRCRGEIMSYGELLERAGVLRDVILAQGVSQGSRIALIGQRGCADYVGMLAILLAGCVYVPLNPKAPKARNTYILQHSEAVGLLTDTECAADLESGLGSALHFVLNSESGIVLSRQQSPADRDRKDFSDGVYIMYTSGTSGQPKGVPITSANLDAYLCSLRACFEIHASDRIAHMSDLSFDLSVHEILLAWTNGAALCCIPQSMALLAARYVEEDGITIWVSVPSAISLAYKAGMLAMRSMASLRLAFFCGEALPISTVRQFAVAAPQAEIFNLWGPTEGTVSLSYFKVSLDAELPEIMPIGVPYTGQLLDLLDADGVPVLPGCIGELWAAGKQITQGYWSSPNLNAEHFQLRDGMRWYRTGDLAVWDSRFGYCFKGRADRQVKVKGYRIELQECESAIRQLGNWAGVCVLPWPRSDHATAMELLAFVDAPAIDAAALKAQLLKCLPAYMVPSRIIAHTPFPYSANGKIDVQWFEGLVSRTCQ